MKFLSLMPTGLAAFAGWWGFRQAVARRRLEAECDVLRAEYTARDAADAQTDGALRSAQEHLRITREQLVRSKRMASLGQLTAGIAHEIKNPLNFVNNFAQLSVDLARELREELEEARERPVGEVLDAVGELLDDLAHNAEKITEHGRRADRIVRTMLMHARTSGGQHQPTDLNALLVEYVNLAYHGMRAADPHFQVSFEQYLDPAVGEVPVAPQEMGRVFINLLNNAFYAVNERSELGEEGYAPTVRLTSQAFGEAVAIRVADNGTGIPEAARARLFEPFFTTKPPGTGTGLGLSLSHEIVTKRHGGTLGVESVEGVGTTFVVTLPRTAPEPAETGEGTDG